MTQAVCFDLDGTLFDDRQYVRAGLESGAEELVAKTGLDKTEEFLEAYFQQGIKQNTFDAVLKDADVSLNIVPDLVSAYHDNEADLVPYPDTVETLEVLQNDFQLGLITGGTNGHDKLRRLGLSDYFQVLIVTPDRGDTKVDPEPFEDAVDALGCSPEDIVYVGDRPEIDFPQPNRLGMRTVRVRRGQYAAKEATDDAHPDATVDTLRELPGVIKAFE